jgi:hypothetical protein
MPVLVAEDLVGWTRHLLWWRHRDIAGIIGVFCRKESSLEALVLLSEAKLSHHLIACSSPFV